MLLQVEIQKRYGNNGSKYTPGFIGAHGTSSYAWSGWRGRWGFIYMRSASRFVNKMFLLLWNLHCLSVDISLAVRSNYLTIELNFVTNILAFVISDLVSHVKYYKNAWIAEFSIGWKNNTKLHCHTPFLWFWLKIFQELM